MAYRVRHSQYRHTRASKLQPRKPFAYREYNDISFEAFREKINNERDFVESFLEHSESQTPCWNTHVIRNFYQISTQTSSVLPQPEIYLDDRERGTDRSRDYPSALTAEKLRQHLEVERFGEGGLPDVDYRQIRIHNLDPESLLALARTAACHQIDTLRDAFAKHISGATSFRVHERVDGFVTPRLELHLPYLTLREVTCSSDQWKNRDMTQDGESWLDLPLPGSDSDAANQSKRFLIEKAHISIVLCVWDYSKWVGYAFSKGGPARNPDAEPDEDEESDGEHSDAEDDDPIPKEDVFAPLDGDHGLFADKLIRDPREYFLRIVNVWIILVLREYTYLVRVLEACVRTWQKEYRCAFSSVSCKRPQESVMQIFDNIVKTVQLLRYIQEQLSLATQAWKDFSDPHGDINCFDDIRDTRARVTLKCIKTSFRELMSLEKIIANLINFCEVSAKNLKLGMGLESQFLNYESNGLNHQSIHFQRETHKGNLEIQRISYMTQELNRLSTEAALRTSHTTRLNVLMIFITTPTLVALQYFGADQPIFTSFDRSPRNFVISLCILALALPVLTGVFDFLYSFLKYLFRLMSRKKLCNTQTPGPPGDHLESEHA